MPTPREILVENRRAALSFVNAAGSKKLNTVMGAAELELTQRLASIQSTTATFTRSQLESALVQLRQVIGGVQGGMKETLLDGAGSAANLGARGTIDYLSRIERQFKGIGTQGMALDEALMFERAHVGARASILRRLASSGQDAPGAPAKPHEAKPGILQRYSINVIGKFEQTMQVGLLARSSWSDMRAKITGESPFLQGAPRHWADRIVRTEMMGAYNRAGWEANREADDQLGDMVKILSATFDDRTGSDSFAVHGQVRRTDQAFQSWYGLYQHPPNRPNDREIVVPHRMSWPLPKYLEPRADAEIKERWALEKRKGSPPARPLMTTVPLNFGAPPPKASERREPRRRVPDEE